MHHCTLYLVLVDWLFNEPQANQSSKVISGSVTIELPAVHSLMTELFLTCIIIYTAQPSKTCR